LDEFDQRAAEYALFQRTQLLPERQSGKIFRVADKLRLRPSYASFVKKHAAQHASEILQDYAEEMRSQFDRRVPFIPPTARSVLDIGCGLAGFDVHMYEYLRGNDPDIYLLDRTQVENSVWYMYHSKGAFYNSLELAKSNLVRNAVPENGVHCIEAPEDGNLEAFLNDVDLVVSTISWGFHYPIAEYLESVARIMSDGAVLLVDIRKGTDGQEWLLRQFPRSTDVVDEGEKYLVVRCVKE
jgi:SAM-dependent methyltransferase